MRKNNSLLLVIFLLVKVNAQTNIEATSLHVLSKICCTMRGQSYYRLVLKEKINYNDLFF